MIIRDDYPVLYISLSVYSDSRSSAELATAIGLAPTHSWNKGDPVPRRPGEIRRQDTCWRMEISSEELDEQRLVSDGTRLFSWCLECLMERVRPVLRQVTALATRERIELRVAGYVDPYPALIFPRTTVKELVEMGCHSLDIDIYGTDIDLPRLERELVKVLVRGRVKGSEEEFAKPLEAKGETIDWELDAEPESWIHELLPHSLRSVLTVARGLEVLRECSVEDIECSVLVAALAVWRPSFAIGREELAALTNLNSDLTITMRVYSSENE